MKPLEASRTSPRNKKHASVTTAVSSGSSTMTPEVRAGRCDGRGVKNPGRWVPRAAGMQPGGDHLPPARLLGQDRAAPAVRCAGKGSGSRRIYSYSDVLELKVIKQLLDAGVSLQSARRAVECLRQDLGTDLASANLVLTGTSSVLARTNGEVVDLLAGGQGVFNIVPLAGVLGELEADIVRLDEATEAKAAAASKSSPSCCRWPRPPAGERRRPAHHRLRRRAPRPPPVVDARRPTPLRPPLRTALCCAAGPGGGALGVRTRRVPAEVGREGC